MASKKGVSNFGKRRAAPFGKKGGGQVPRGGYTPGRAKAGTGRGRR